MSGFVAPEGVKPDKLEFLGDGQQFVANGIHPDTGGEYVWIGGDPGTVKREELPEISAEEAEQLQNDVTAMLVRDFGYVVAEPAKKSSSTERAARVRHQESETRSCVGPGRAR